MNTRPVSQSDLDKFFAKQRERNAKRRLVIEVEKDAETQPPPLKKQTLAKEEDAPCINALLPPDVIRTILLNVPCSTEPAIYLVCSYWTNILRASQTAVPNLNSAVHACVCVPYNDLAFLYMGWKSPGAGVLATAAGKDNRVILDWLLARYSYTHEEQDAALYEAAERGHTYPFCKITYKGSYYHILIRVVRKDHANLLNFLITAWNLDREHKEKIIELAFEYGAQKVILFAVETGLLTMRRAFLFAYCSRHPELLDALYATERMTHDELCHLIDKGVWWTICHDNRAMLVALLDLARLIHHDRNWEEHMEGTVPSQYLNSVLCLLTGRVDRCACFQCIANRLSGIGPKT